MNTNVSNLRFMEYLVEVISMRKPERNSPELLLIEISKFLLEQKADKITQNINNSAAQIIEYLEKLSQSIEKLEDKIDIRYDITEIEEIIKNTVASVSNEIREIKQINGKNQLKQVIVKRIERLSKCEEKANVVFDETKDRLREISEKTLTLLINEEYISVVEVQSNIENIVYSLTEHLYSVKSIFVDKLELDAIIRKAVQDIENERIKLVEEIESIKTSSDISNTQKLHQQYNKHSREQLKLIQEIREQALQELTQKGQARRKKILRNYKIIFLAIIIASFIIDV